MALIKPLHADFELTENECLFGMYQAFQKCIPLYFAPSLSMKCTVASCVWQCPFKHFPISPCLSIKKLFLKALHRAVLLDGCFDMTRFRNGTHSIIYYMQV